MVRAAHYDEVEKAVKTTNALNLLYFFLTFAELRLHKRSDAYFCLLTFVRIHNRPTKLQLTAKQDFSYQSKRIEKMQYRVYLLRLGRAPLSFRSNRNNRTLPLVYLTYLPRKR